MKLTDAEWQIMNVLWERYPTTARGIAERLPAEITWAYNTIRTILVRLQEKGAVHEYKEGKRSLYEPLLTRTQARRSALKTVMTQAFDGAVGPMMHFLLEDKKLSDKQRDELLDIVRQYEKK